MTLTVTDFDFELASHPEFGSSHVILERRAQFYRLALACIPEAADLAERICCLIPGTRISL